MTYPFVAARYDFGPRKGPIRGIVLHMAEGGHTVGYLEHAPDRSVSVHYVVELSGRVVQMLPLDHACGGLNPALVRRDDDPPFRVGLATVRGGQRPATVTYGITEASRVLGGWVTDPNSATVQVEIEGFARTGPNPAQVMALRSLIAFLEATCPSIRGVLGHRDLQRYKACPGHLLPWGSIGGHGRRSAVAA
jgi:N-acetyl-anhydromuramyl-L-alanine amidase AmpD